MLMFGALVSTNVGSIQESPRGLITIGPGMDCFGGPRNDTSSGKAICTQGQKGIGWAKCCLTRFLSSRSFSSLERFTN